MNSYRRDVVVTHAQKAIKFYRDQLESLGYIEKNLKKSLSLSVSCADDGSNRAFAFANNIAEVYKNLCTTTDFRFHKTTWNNFRRIVVFSNDKPIADLIKLSIDGVAEQLGKIGKYQIRIVQTSKRFENNRFDVIHTNAKPSDHFYIADIIKTMRLYRVNNVVFDIEIRFNQYVSTRIDEKTKEVREVGFTINKYKQNIKSLECVLCEAQLIDSNDTMMLTDAARSAIIEFIQAGMSKNGDMANTITS